MDDEKLNKIIAEEVKRQLSSTLFTARKLTDTPRDALQIVPRSYVTRYSTTANRPKSSVLGEHVFDTNLLKPVWWSGSSWVDGAGSIS